MTTRTCLRQSMGHGTVAQTERNPRGPVSAHNLFVLPSGGVPPDKLQRTFLCGRRLNDVATIVPMRQCQLAKPPILAQHLAVFAHRDAVDLLVVSPRRPPARCRLPLRLVQSFSGLPTGLQGSPRRRLRSLPTVKCRSHTRKCFSSRFCGGQWPRVLREQLGPVPQSTSRPAHPRALPRPSPW